MSYRKVIALFVAAAVALPFISQAGVEKGHEFALVVVPAKQKLIQYAFDLAIMRNIAIVSYDKAPKTGKMTLHVWDKEVLQWVKTSFEEIKDGSIFKDAPKTTILIGTDGQAMGTFTGFLPGDVKSIVSADIVNLASSTSEIFIFNANEWKWLAKRHNIEIKDLNEDRRRYGRYGKPGEVPMPTPEQEPSKGGPVLTPTPIAPVAEPVAAVAPVAPVPDAKTEVAKPKDVKPSADLAPVKPEDK